MINCTEAYTLQERDLDFHREWKLEQEAQSVWLLCRKQKSLAFTGNPPLIPQSSNL
jgi:hypothetical protein